MVLEGVPLGAVAVAAVAIATFVLERKLPYKKMLIVTGVLLTVGARDHGRQDGAHDAGRGLDADHARSTSTCPTGPASGWGSSPPWRPARPARLAAVFVIGSYLLAERLKEAARGRRVAAHRDLRRQWRRQRAPARAAAAYAGPATAASVAAAVAGVATARDPRASRAPMASAIAIAPDSGRTMTTSSVTSPSSPTRQVVPTLDLLRADTRAKHEPLGALARKLVDVAEVLEHLDHVAQEVHHGVAALVGLEDDRRAERHVGRQRRLHGVQVLGLDG